MTVQLSPRQLEILRLIAAGHSVREAAAAAGCSAWTVRSHLRIAYERLGVTSAVEAFRELGWLTPPTPPARDRDGAPAA